jgi:hypothetical protein
MFHRLKKKGGGGERTITFERQRQMETQCYKMNHIKWKHLRRRKRMRWAGHVTCIVEMRNA